VHGQAVMGEQGVQESAEHAPLWGPSVISPLFQQGTQPETKVSFTAGPCVYIYSLSTMIKKLHKTNKTDNTKNTAVDCYMYT
jgi:mevalonate pyrophosphate decarboxylase